MIEAMNGGVRTRAGCVVLAMIGSITLMSGCSPTRQQLPVLTGVRSVSIESYRTFSVPFLDDLKSANLRDAVVRGPHYTLGIAWTATGGEVRKSAEALRLAPVRAAEGKQLLLAAVNPKLTYAAFEPSPTDNVIVEVVVDGTATKLDGLPLPPPTTFGGAAVQTRLLVLSARPKAPVQLRVTDAGRTNSIDLRTGKPAVDAKGGYLQRQADVNWEGESPVVLVNRFGYRNPGPLEVSDTFTVQAVPASLTTYRPGRGWAAPGRAYLSVPAPNVSFGAGISVFFGTLHAAFDDANAFALQLPYGKPIPAVSLRRDITLGLSGQGARQAALVFVVPADMSSGGVSFDLARTRLSEAVGTGRRSVPWAQAPKPFTLPLTLKQ